MVYIIRGSRTSAKSVIACSLAEFLTAQPVKIGGYEVIPDRNNVDDPEIYAIKKDGEIVYKQNITDGYETIDEVNKNIDKIKSNIKDRTAVKLYLPNNCRFRYSDDEGDKEYNEDAYELFVDTFKGQINNNKHIVIVSGIHGDYLAKFKRLARANGHDVTVIGITRDPLYSFMMNDNLNIFVSKTQEDQCEGIFIFNNLHFMYKFKHECSVMVKFEDIIKDEFIRIDGKKFYIDKNLLAGTEDKNLTVFEEKYKSKTRHIKKNRYVSLIKEIVSKRFDEYVGKPGELPKNMAAEFGYTY